MHDGNEEWSLFHPERNNRVVSSIIIIIKRLAPAFCTFSMYVMLKAAPFHTIRFTSPPRESCQLIMPGPNSTGRREVPCIRHFVPKIQFHPSFERRDQLSSPARPVLEGLYPPPLLFNIPAPLVLALTSLAVA